MTPTRAISASMIFHDVRIKIFCSSVTYSIGGGPISKSFAWLTVECFLGGIAIWWSLTSESCLTMAFPILPSSNLLFFWPKHQFCFSPFTCDSTYQKVKWTERKNSNNSADVSVCSVTQQILLFLERYTCRK